MTDTKRPARPVRIGGASGFWGDSTVGAPQLVGSGLIDYLVVDYLAETTMAILAAVRAKKPALGYATDFVDTAMKQVLPQVMQRGIKVVANAGGINPRGCAAALKALADSMGLAPRIAVGEGDDVSAQMADLRAQGTRDMYTGEPLPAEVVSANGYLGALPIAPALATGADNWTDLPDWARIGYPIIDCTEDGSFELTNAPGTGGLIHRACVAEQMLYEIGDPSAYMLPDVACDFGDVRIEQVSADCSRVSGKRGRAPTGTYKVSATQLDGYRCAGMMVVVGIDAAAKARRTGEAIIERTRGLLAAAGLPDYTAAHIELLGAETLYGANARTGSTREAMMRTVVDPPMKKALEMFAREIAPAGTSWSPGATMPGGGRPAPSPLIKRFSFLLDKRRVPAAVGIDAERLSIDIPTASDDTAVAPIAPPAAWVDPVDEPLVDVPLVKLARGRSGDKGNLSNIGLIARRAEWLPLLWSRLTPEVVQHYFAGLVKGRVKRFHLPGIAGVNLVLHDALAGGGPALPRFDPLGKGMAQMLLDLKVAVPASMAARL